MFDDAEDERAGTRGADLRRPRRESRAASARNGTSTAAARTSRRSIIAVGSISSHRDLDEEVRRAPDPGDDEEQRARSREPRSVRYPSRSGPSDMVGSSLELGRGTAASPRARPDGRGIRPHQGSARAPRRTTSSWPFSPSSGRSTAGTSTRRCSCAASRPRAPACCRGPGENAGVVDLGEGEAVAFKVESHNHPSAVEPFQGAATGVGGILRDVVAMGARPVALLDGLRFGRPGFDFGRAVAGIGHYGNCVGVPTVGGDTFFADEYAANPLVNAMCVGLVPTRARRARARDAGPGDLVVLYGATTGRDGIGGASVLASQELSDEDDDKRPTVQIGDPFTGKKLIEASLELVEGGLVEGAPGSRRRRASPPRSPRWRAAAESGSTSTSTASPSARPTWIPSRSSSPRARSAWSASQTGLDGGLAPSARSGSSSARGDRRS